MSQRNRDQVEGPNHNQSRIIYCNLSNVSISTITYAEKASGAGKMGSWNMVWNVREETDKGEKFE